MKPFRHNRGQDRADIGASYTFRWRPACLVWFAALAIVLSCTEGLRAEDGGSGIPAETKAAAASLSEDAAARFIASLAPMRRLGREIAQRAALVETNLEDPLMPYAHLAPGQLAAEAELAPLLERYGFSDIGAWLAVGKPLMQAYYHVSGSGRDREWERQLAETLTRIQGLDESDPDRRAARIARLLADLQARREAQLPKSDIEIARKFRRSLELATDGTIK